MTREQARAHRTGRPVSKEAAARWSPGRVRFSGVLLILLSLISAVLCYVAFATWLPSDRERYRDYRAAGPCPAHATAQVAKECLSTWPFIVVKTIVKGGKNAEYKATLKGDDSWRGVVDFGDPGPLLEELKPGDQVTATVWRRDIVVLSKDGVRQNSSEAPRDELQMNAALGMLAALVGAQTLVFGAARLVRPRHHEPFTWKPYGKWLSITIVAACFGVGLMAVWTGIPWEFVPAVTGPAVVYAAVLMFNHLRPGGTAAV